MSARDPATAHDGHDLLLVAAHAAGDTSGAEAARATALLAACGQCRELEADLIALSATTRRLPPPQRSRDFRLSPETAARLRSRSPWRRLVDGITAPRGIGRPLAATLMTLGLAGLMVSATPLGAPLSGQSTSRESNQQVLAPADAGSGFSGAAPQVASPAATVADRTSQDAATGGGTTDTAKGAPGAAGASASPAVPPAAMAAAPSAATGSAASPGSAAGAATPGSAPTGAGNAASRQGGGAAGAESGSTSGPDALTASGGAGPTRDATAGRGWAGPSPLALLSGAFLLAGLAILVVRRRAPSLHS